MGREDIRGTQEKMIWGERRQHHHVGVNNLGKKYGSWQEGGNQKLPRREFSRPSCFTDSWGGEVAEAAKPPEK